MPFRFGLVLELALVQIDASADDCIVVVSLCVGLSLLLFLEMYSSPGSPGGSPGGGSAPLENAIVDISESVPVGSRSANEHYGVKPLCYFVVEQYAEQRWGFPCIPEEKYQTK